MDELPDADTRQIGSYTLLRQLGAGGMGQVFLGRSLARPVAIKVIHPHLAADPGFRVRFAREADAARRVSGAFTAPVIDVNADAPLPWLVTAYVNGPSLATAVAVHGPLPVSSVLTLAGGLAEALSAAHARRHPPRSQARSVLLAADGPRADRLRHLSGRRPLAGTARPRASRHLRLHIARDGRGPRGRTSERHLQPRRGAAVRCHRHADVPLRLASGPVARANCGLSSSAAWPWTRRSGLPPPSSSPN